ncbi:PAS domain-containing protein [Aliiroseovarius sp. S253]|uniref:PAS domain-containing protein n=1 Tax=Aliiroseovarius sp. S253 TaxID=3415133 RepID=UPI003C7C7686
MRIEYLRDGNVVSLLSARQTKSYPSIAQVEAYWEGLRNGRICPTRKDVDPRGIAGALHEAFILEKIAPGLARFRLAGQHLNDILGMEVRGMPISAFFLPDARKELHRAIEALFDTPSQVTMSLITEPSTFRKQHEAQLVMLPLRDSTGQITRVLGALQVDGTLKRAPNRFSIQSVEITPIVVDNDVAQTLVAYQDGQDEPKRTPRPLDTRIGTGSVGRKGHVYRDKNPNGTDLFREFAEAQRHFEMPGKPPFHDSGAKAKSAHLKLVTSD